MNAAPNGRPAAKEPNRTTRSALGAAVIAILLAADAGAAEATKRVPGVGAVCNREPAHCVWIGAEWSKRYSGRPDHEHLRRYSESATIAIVNPGNREVKVQCAFFGRDSVEVTTVPTGGALAPGRQGTCRDPRLGDPSDEDAPYTESGWVLVVADGPVVVEGWSEGAFYFWDAQVRRPVDLAPSRRTLRLRPLDCTDPAGREYACEFAASLPF